MLQLAQAQVKQKDIPNLSQLHVGFGFMPALAFEPVNFVYTPTNFKRATIGINYLNGYIKYNLQYSFIEASDSLKIYPNCKLLDNSIGYTYYIPLFKNGYIFGGAQLGLNTRYMNVSGTKLSSDASLETEMSSGLELGFEIRVKRKLGIGVSYKHQRIFSFPRNKLSLLDIGLVYYLNSNTKLKKWLD